MLILGYLELETSYWPPASNDNGCSSTAWNLKKRKAFSAFLRFELKWIIYCYIANMRGSLSSDIQSQRSGFEAQWAAKVFEMNIRNDWMSAVLTLRCSTLILKLDTSLQHIWWFIHTQIKLQSTFSRWVWEQARIALPFRAQLFEGRLALTQG